MIKAYDVNLDRSLPDGGLDSWAGSGLVREANTVFRTQFAERQRMAVVSNYFALACPIMPLGWLGIFMLLGKLDSVWSCSYDGRRGQSGRHRLAKQFDEQSQENYLRALQEKGESGKKRASLAGYGALPVELVKPARDKTGERREAQLQIEGKPSQRLNGPNLLSKRQNDASKLIKQKLALEEHLDKLNGEQSYHLYCRVSAQIDLLERALKKLGS